MSGAAARPRLAALSIADPPQTWERLGFTVNDGACRIGATTIHLGAAGTGITGWALQGAGTGVDGLPEFDPRPLRKGEGAAHPNAVCAIDHVVVATPDFDRTVRALADAEIDVRGQSTGTAGGRPVRRAFGLLREALIEVVGAEEAGRGSAAFWGLTLVSADLETTAAAFGPGLGPARDAVQPGRRIATATEAAGVSVRLAVMTPR